MKKAAIITPSWIWNAERAGYAVTSMASMLNAAWIGLDHYVIDDSKIEEKEAKDGRGIAKKAAESIYRDCKMLDGDDEGMLDATISAARWARSEGAELVFLHLDDTFYVHPCRQLMKWAIEAMSKDDNLKVIHLSNFPLLDKTSSKELGNLTYLEVGKDEVRFDTTVLKPTRYDDFTLWSSPFEEGMVSRFWPLACWFAFYEADFFIDLMERFADSPPDSVPSVHAGTLAGVEVFYRDPTNWMEVVERGGSLGHINMQFGGLEMHRNKNFMELVGFPNRAVL